MGTEVATTGKSGGLLDRYKQGHNPFLDDAGADEFFGSFLKFSGNNGDYTYGDDYEEELPHGSELLLNMETALHGWICWVEGQVIDEVNVLIASGKPIPKEDELEDHGPYEKHDDGTQDGWQEQYVFHLFHEKTNQGFTLKLSSRSAIRAAKNLVRAYGKSFGVKIGADGDIQVPVIDIGSTSFDVKKADGTINKKAGKKHAPTFKIVDWVDKSEVADLFEASGGDDKNDYEEDEDEQDRSRERSDDRGSSSRGRGRDNDDDRGSSRRGRGNDDEDDRGSSSRGRGRGRDDDDEDEDDRDSSRRGRGRDTDDEEDQGASEPRGGRRARVVHAEPQDEDEEETTSPRESARGRRGRSRD